MMAERLLFDEMRQMNETLKRIEALLRLQTGDEGADMSEHCTECGSFDLKDASAMGDERVVCGGCGANFRKEPVNG